jgi:small-conductance mechanosensitive channel
VDPPARDHGTMPAFAILGIVLAAGIGLDAIGNLLTRPHRGRQAQTLARSIVTNVRRPVQIIVPLLAVEIAVATVDLRDTLRNDLLHGIGVLLIAATAFLVVRLTYVIDDLVLDRYRVDIADNLRARQVHTQIQVLRRVTVAAVTILALAISLLSFPSVRAAGAGLLASAGLIAVVAGIAAKPTVSNVVAGLQLAISQPIRVDDVVVVEGHWGRVEQIALTYVVVRVWDLRRLVLPISYFVENPFENWTRSTADILGWVHIDVDFSAPVDAIREEFHRILSNSPDWDGKVWGLQVTGFGPTTMQLRCLMSARDSSVSWNLQCEVREKLIDFLHRNHPEAIPRLRTAPAADRTPGTPADPGTDPGPDPGPGSGPVPIPDVTPLHDSLPDPPSPSR